MGSRNKKDKRKKKKGPGRQTPSLRPSGFPGNINVIRNPPGEIKMSEVFWEFIEPYAAGWRTEDQLRNLLGLAVLGWNIAVIPASKREEFLRTMQQSIPADLRAGMRAIVEEMM